MALLLLLLGASCQTAPATATESAPDTPPQQAYGELVTASPPDTLFRFDDADGMPGYRNQRGDTIVPAGRYLQAYADTITTFGVVLQADAGPRLAALNTRGEEMYEVYWFDNGPDYIEEGRFRILRNGLIGYADATGRIVIEPQYACASPFQDGRARVTFDCQEVSDHPDDEHTRMESEEWFEIDTTGQRVR
jgi:hypothetical protein